MRILFFIPTLGNGGAERVLLHILNNHPDDVDVHLKTLFHQGRYLEKLKSDIKYSYVFPKPFRGNIHLLKMFKPEWLYKIIIKGEYDIVISFLEGPTTRIVGGGTEHTTLLINWIHTAPEKEIVIKKAYRSRKELINVYRRYSKTIFVAESARCAFFKLFPELVGINATVVYNPIDSVNIETNSLKKPTIAYADAFNIIAVGRLSSVKGFDRLIKAICRVSSYVKNIHLYIVGEGEEREKLERLIISSKAQALISLLGYQSNPYSLMKHADLYVCSSRREGYSSTVIESIIVGTPVLATDCSGMHEILGDSEYGLIVENSEDGLCSGIEQMINNTELYNKYKMAVLERKACFDFYSSIKNVYSNIMN